MAKFNRVNYNAEVTLDNCDELLKINNLFLNRYYFRGQASCDWPLATSIERLVSSYHKYDDIQRPQLPEIYERKTLAEFQHKYPLYNSVNLPPKEDLVEWLSIMQHYGTKTRLLDFTKSFFVALYMALENSEDDIAIWGVNSEFLNKKYEQLYQKENNSREASPQDIQRFIKDRANLLLKGTLLLDYPEILIIHPDFVNERIVRKQGLFLMPSSIQHSFNACMNNLIWSEPIVCGTITCDKFITALADTTGNSANPHIVIFKLVIPKKLKLQLVNMLIQMNVTPETLYPGLEGLCKSLNHMRDHKLHYD